MLELKANSEDEADRDNNRKESKTRQKYTAAVPVDLSEEL